MNGDLVNVLDTIVECRLLLDGLLVGLTWNELNLTQKNYGVWMGQAELGLNKIGPLFPSPPPALSPNFFLSPTI